MRVELETQSTVACLYCMSSHNGNPRTLRPGSLPSLKRKQSWVLNMHIFTDGRRGSSCPVLSKTLVRTQFSLVAPHTGFCWHQPIGTFLMYRYQESIVVCQEQRDAPSRGDNRREVMLLNTLKKDWQTEETLVGNVWESWQEFIVCRYLTFVMKENYTIANGNSLSGRSLR